MAQPNDTRIGPDPTAHRADRLNVNPARGSAGRSLVFELVPKVMHGKCIRVALPNDAISPRLYVQNGRPRRPDKASPARSGYK